MIDLADRIKIRLAMLGIRNGVEKIERDDPVRALEEFAAALQILDRLAGPQARRVVQP